MTIDMKLENIITAYRKGFMAAERINAHKVDQAIAGLLSSPEAFSKINERIISNHPKENKQQTLL